MKQAMRVLTSSETNEWYTPKLIITRARWTMGGIALDPASCPAVNRWIRARRIFTAEDDGLAQDWHGTVWLNTPYGKTGNRSNQDIWARKLEAEREAGRVTQACLLTKSVPGYAWWERLFRRYAVCMLRERVEFLRLDEGGEVIATGKAKAGTSIWYLGPYVKRFQAYYQDLGRVIPPPSWTWRRR